MTSIPPKTIETEQERTKLFADALHDLLDHVDQNTCTHESTHRGGSIWTICDDCGAMWADDMGGFKPYVDPAPVAKARKLLSNIGAAKTYVTHDDFDFSDMPMDGAYNPMGGPL